MFIRESMKKGVRCGRWKKPRSHIPTSRRTRVPADRRVLALPAPAPLLQTSSGALRVPLGAQWSTRHFLPFVLSSHPFPCPLLPNSRPQTLPHPRVPSVLLGTWVSGGGPGQAWVPGVVWCEVIGLVRPPDTKAHGFWWLLRNLQFSAS